MSEFMNTEAFTGKAQAYTNARPGYPDEATEYICSLVKPDAVFADVGAGTGKFTSLIALRCRLFRGRCGSRSSSQQSTGSRRAVA